ncbi:hypothetical protein J8273_0204 [Carpediemonas membranifera]|uniref:Uncharacterized protein n=1 Tax=Carpediemonas membranifera TaxID=201153 RepID=A0A8J6AUF2_9EUKA|nr:hypothetical protein J8273_0204 [Carpediemonas membranifera]|eukprot:KAG9394996.1 hypothetical protein J8273_0204 [Carpediemonas membranifera]
MQEHFLFYSLLLSVPTAAYLLLTRYSRRNMFESDTLTWQEQAWFAVDNIVVYVPLYTFPCIAALLAYGSKLKNAFVVLAAYTGVTLVGSLVCSLVVTRFLPVNVSHLPLLPLMAFIAVYLCYIGHKTGFIRPIQVIGWFLPFVADLAFVDLVILRLYFSESLHDGSISSFLIKAAIRMIAVPLMTGLFAFIAHVVAISLRGIPNNQRLAPTCGPSAFKSVMKYLMLAHASSAREIAVMMVWNALSDAVFRLTSMFRDMMAVWAIKKGAALFKPPPAPATASPAVPSAVLAVPSMLGDRLQSPVSSAGDATPAIATGRDVIEGAGELASAQCTDTESVASDGGVESLPTDEEAAPASDRGDDGHETGSTGACRSMSTLLTRPDHPDLEAGVSPGLLYPTVDDTTPVHHHSHMSLKRLVSNGSFVKEADKHGHAEKFFGVPRCYTSFMINESCLDYAALFGVTLMTMAYQIIFDGQPVSLSSLQLPCIELVVGLVVDFFIFGVWSMPQIITGRKLLILKAWHHRSVNMILHLFAANWVCATFLTYRVFEIQHKLNG